MSNNKKKDAARISETDEDIASAFVETMMASAQRIASGEIKADRIWLKGKPAILRLGNEPRPLFKLTWNGSWQTYTHGLLLTPCKDGSIKKCLAKAILEDIIHPKR